MFGLIFVCIGGCSTAVNTEGDCIDLTGLSSIVVDAQVTDMFNNPNEYRGKLVRISGTCNVYTDSSTNKTYYTALINASCCPKGLEFVLKSGNYPTQGKRIIVEGSFGTYKEDGYTYCQLYNAKLI